jgi:hypothetical protein
MVFITQGILLNSLQLPPCTPRTPYKLIFLYPNIKKMNNPIVFCEKNYIFAIEKEI